MKYVLLMLAAVLPATWLLASCGSRDSAAEPAGVVERPDQVSAGGPSSTAWPTPAPAYDLQLGKAVFTNVCLGCHGSGVYDAPIFGDAAAWEPRLTQDQNTLIRHAIDGHGRMPPKGGFFALSDREVASAVAYAVDRGRKIIRAGKRKAAIACSAANNPDGCSDEEFKDVLTLQLLWLLGGKGSEAR